MSRKFTLVSGYWAGETETGKRDFHQLWYDNTMRFIPACTENLFIVNHGSQCLPPVQPHEQWINLTHNAGYAITLGYTGPDPGRLCGWSQAFLLGCQLAALNGSDLLFKEQDCLVFGDVLTPMYDVLTKAGGGLVCGGPACSNDQPLEQSLVLVDYEDTLRFVEAFLGIPQSDNQIYPEGKWKLLRESKRFQINYFPFEGGRSRPCPVGNMQEPFFLQHMVQPEVDALRARGLI
jgi:hypothetical protein